MLERLKTFWAINLFSLRVISPPNPFFFLLSLGLLVFGIYSTVTNSDIVHPSVTAVGAVAVIMQLVPVAVKFFLAPKADFGTDPLLKDILQQLELSEGYINRGFKVIKQPTSEQLVVMSETLNTTLRTTTFTVQENVKHLTQLNEMIRSNQDLYNQALRVKLRDKSGRAFTNEEKFCLTGELVTPDKPVSIARGTYFHSFLTNELCSKTIVSTSNIIQHNGANQFPADPTISGAMELRSLGRTMMGDHLGVSALLHTGDGKLIIWRQNTKTQQNNGQFVPTSSGSVDWADFDQFKVRGNLQDVMVKAMERELAEESSGTSHGDRFEQELNRNQMATEITGFFRWVWRGGKPEFVGVTKTALDVSEFVPDPKEMEKVTRYKTEYDATTLAELTSSLQTIMALPEASVPLWTTAYCLNEAIESDPQRWCHFLNITMETT